MKRKNKKIYVFLVMTFIVPMLCSCTGYTEIENMDILTSHFVYKNEGKIQLGGGIANVRTLSDGMADKPVSYISAQADTLYEASQKLRLSADHKLFYGGIRALVIGEEYAQDGINEFLNYVQNLPDHRTSVSVFTSSVTPRDIVNYKAVNDFSGGFAAESIVRTLQNEKEMITCSLSDIWEARAQGQVGFVIPDIQIYDDVMSVSGYSVFDKEKKILHVDALSGRALNYILSKKAKAEYVLTLPDDFECNVAANMAKKSIDVYENENGKLKINASFVFDITVTTQGADELSEDKKDYISSSITEIIKGEIDTVFNISKKHKCDFLKLYKAYQTKKRSKFYELDWESMIGSMDISTDVSIGKIQNDTVR